MVQTFDQGPGDSGHRSTPTIWAKSKHENDTSLRYCTVIPASLKDAMLHIVTRYPSACGRLEASEDDLRAVMDPECTSRGIITGLG